MKDLSRAKQTAEGLFDWLNTQRGWIAKGLLPSSIAGADGNLEYLLFGEKRVSNRVVIDHIGASGHGISNISHDSLSVPFTLPGEVAIVALRGKYGKLIALEKNHQNALMPSANILKIVEGVFFSIGMLMLIALGNDNWLLMR